MVDFPPPEGPTRAVNFTLGDGQVQMVEHFLSLAAP